MKTFLPLGIAIASSLAAASAFAQDATPAAQDSTSVESTYTTNDSSSYGDSAYKRFAVVGSATVLQPYSNPVDGARLDIDGDVAPTLSASWYVTPNIAVELWGAADKFEHRVRGDSGKIGTLEQQPIALSGQYHFGASDWTFRPFVGVGYYESNFSGESIDGLGDGSHVGLETAKGAIGTVGVDMNINPTWFARVDARYLRSRSDVTFDGISTGEEAKLDPWTLGFGVGARF